MTALTREIMKGTERTIRKATLAAITEGVLRTPVKTGRAIASWMVGLGKPATGRREGANSNSIDTNRTIGTADSLIPAMQKINAWRMGSGDLYISNTAEYSGDLDRGTSRQAPAGMSVFAIEAARRVLRKARLLKNGR